MPQWLFGLAILLCLGGFAAAIYLGRRGGLRQLVARAESAAYARGQADLRAQLTQNVAVSVPVTIGHDAGPRLGRGDAAEHATLASIAEGFHASLSSTDEHPATAAGLAGRGRPVALSRSWGSDPSDSDPAPAGLRVREAVIADAAGE